MASFKALYGQKCRSPICWTEVGERKLLGPKIVQQITNAIKVVQRRLQTAQTSYKSFADVQRQPLEFEVKDYVFLMVSPLNGIVSFGKRGKLNLQFISSYQIVDRVSAVAY